MGGMRIETTVIIALIALAQLLLLTLVQARITSRKELRDAEIRRQDKREDYDRQDKVAERVALAAKQAADAAQLLVKAQHETIVRTDEVARIAKDSDARISAQLMAIHKLVNADMTAARTNERDQTVLTLLALKRVQKLGDKLALPPDPDAQKAINDTEARIVVLNQILKDRIEAQKQIDDELIRYGEAMARRANDAKPATSVAPVPPLVTPADLTPAATEVIAAAAVDAVAKKLAE